ncbi:hypothetical protein Atai01_11580 [Amycolatopsis taiwanensis]|uniref:Uncharacterized protein n=1 Tax=Amycolatopsis taiwanensis TaxID=342230 RepID=A0A9W6VF63_9PSEU|nr:hypothetical protein Atai01_11580 [Amycolatopsis taiwanensis]
MSPVQDAEFPVRPRVSPVQGGGFPVRGALSGFLGFVREPAEGWECGEEGFRGVKMAGGGMGGGARWRGG